MQKVIVHFVICLGTAALGFNNDYCPFAGELPKVFPLKTFHVDCHGQDLPDGGVRLSISAEGATHNVTLSRSSKNKTAILTVTDLSGKSVMKDYAYDGTLEFGATFRTGRLNEDTVDDWIVELETVGNGLAAWGARRLVLLSSPKGFRLIPLYTLFADDADYVDLNKDGKGEMIHTRLIYGEKGADGESHNYWVYNLLEFKGTDVASANHMDARFPCWIMYTNKDSHKPTDQLTAEQRGRLWREQGDSALTRLSEEQ